MRAHKYRRRQPKVEETKSSGSSVPRPGVERTAKVVGPLARTNRYSADVLAEAFGLAKRAIPAVSAVEGKEPIRP